MSSARRGVWVRNDCGLRYPVRIPIPRSRCGDASLTCAGGAKGRSCIPEPARPGENVDGRTHHRFFVNQRHHRTGEPDTSMRGGAAGKLPNMHANPIWCNSLPKRNGSPLENSSGGVGIPCIGARHDGLSRSRADPASVEVRLLVLRLFQNLELPLFGGMKRSARGNGSLDDGDISIKEGGFLGAQIDFHPGRPRRESLIGGFIDISRALHRVDRELPDLPLCPELLRGLGKVHNGPAADTRCQQASKPQHREVELNHDARRLRSVFGEKSPLPNTSPRKCETLNRS